MQDSNKSAEAVAAHQELVDNARKALELKQQAGSQTNIPEHQTAREGKISGPQFRMTDRDAGSEGSHQPQLKRSHAARSGDS